MLRKEVKNMPIKEKLTRDNKVKVCVNLTRYAKVELTDRANRMGISLSSYLEYLARLDILKQ